MLALPLEVVKRTQDSRTPQSVTDLDSFDDICDIVPEILCLHREGLRVVTIFFSVLVITAQKTSLHISSRSNSFFRILRFGREDVASLLNEDVWGVAMQIGVYL
jgi:hypothetical protein